MGSQRICDEEWRAEEGCLPDSCRVETLLCSSILGVWPNLASKVRLGASGLKSCAPCIYSVQTVPWLRCGRSQALDPNTLLYQTDSDR